MKSGGKLVGGLVACVATLTVGAVMILLPGPAAAGGPLELVVDTLDDHLGIISVGDGECDDGPDGACTLREAVAVARFNGAGGNITFSVDGVFVLQQEIVVEGGGPVSIEGNGVDKTIVEVDTSPQVQKFRGNGNEDRHFYLQNADLSLEGMTLREGSAHSVGGSIYLAYLASLSTKDVHFVDNEAGFQGGAIYADAENDTLEVDSTTFVGNAAGEEGGAIYVGYDTAEVTNSTFTANSAPNGAAIAVSHAGTLGVTWSTFSQNVLTARVDPNSQSFQSMRSSAAAPQAPVSGATIYVNFNKGPNPDVTIGHSILEKTSGTGTDECAGAPIVSEGANIVDDDSCGFVSALDDEGTAANVGPLQDNGGATFTMALAADSAAVDVDPAACSVNDQRDLPRNTDGDGDGTDACDSGAYELQAESEETTTTSTTEPGGAVDADTATPATPTVARPTFTG